MNLPDFHKIKHDSPIIKNHHRKKYIYQKLMDYLNFAKSGKNLTDCLGSTLKVAKNSNLKNFTTCVKKLYRKSNIESRIPIIFLIDYLFRNLEIARSSLNLEPFVVHIMEKTYKESHFTIRLKLSEILNEWETKDIYSSEARFRIRKTFQFFKSKPPAQKAPKPSKKNIKKEKNKNKGKKGKKEKIEFLSEEKKSSKKQKLEGPKSSCFGGYRPPKSDRTSRREAIATLYDRDKKQCGECGCRVAKEAFLGHLNSHFDSALSVDAEQKVVSRSYYLSAAEWVENAKTYFGEENPPKRETERTRNGGLPREKLDLHQIDAFPPFCDICREMFSKKYDQQAQQWVYRGTEKSKSNVDVLVHFECANIDEASRVIEID